MTTTFRPAVHEDIAAVLAFWRQSTEPSSTDNAPALEQLLDHDPGALILAESSGRIIGSVIGAWDGWRGTIYRLAVAPGQRRSGLGTELVHAAERQLETRGAVRLQATVIATDSLAMGFWQRSDWTQAVEQTRFTKG
jgi:ribosomal protein S18 acetylase RimI-like enzyme